MGGVALLFKELEFVGLARSGEAVPGALQPPTLDAVLDTLLAANKGRELGPDAIPLELIVLGGLPAAKLLHVLIVPKQSQQQAPMC